MDGELERYSAAFAEFMTPDEEGEPLLLATDLKHAIQEAGLPIALASKLLPLMDPEGKGSIGFEKFVSVCSELENGNEGNENGILDPTRKPEKASIVKSGHLDPSETETQRKVDISEEEPEVESEENEALEEESDEGGGFMDDYEDDDDEDFKDEEVDATIEEKDRIEPTLQSVFNTLSGGQGHITVDSLARAGQFINLHVPRSDMEKMIEKASSLQDFKRLWLELEQPRQAKRPR